MKKKSEILVTLSDELMDQLRAQARRLHVPLKWLVAGMVCDTIEMTDGASSAVNDSTGPGRQVACVA